ncbi:hypothetical protein [Campylobacter sputorum]|uniref:hypothetical protein n=1 Tax=Campylobacter sputorum TaxID=206 RepID=UPI00053C03C7|nr:hypothetical protein [Campylobacter sputorum]
MLFSSHTCKKVFLDLEDKAILNNGSAGISNEGIYGIILRAGITPKSGAIFTKKIKNCFIQAYKILYDNDNFIKWFDKIWSKNSPANFII